jgi:Lrp/AsnC family transcriptional regulator for asnA, asnC and gidA
MIDELDSQIISLMIKNGRLTSKVLANKLNVNSSTIRRRVRHLIEDGAIHIIALPEFFKAGFPVQAIIGLDIDKKELNNALQTICAIPECKFVSVTVGRFNVMIILWCHSTAEIHVLVQKITCSLKGLKDCETFICMNMAKSISPMANRIYLSQIEEKYHSPLPLPK